MQMRLLSIAKFDFRDTAASLVRPLGMGAIFRPKCGKHEWFTKMVLGTERIIGHNSHQ